MILLLCLLLHSSQNIHIWENGLLWNWVMFRIIVIRSICGIDKIEIDCGMAGLHPFLFAFIVLTSRLSGTISSDAKMDPWLIQVTCTISMINSSENLFCRTMSSRALVHLDKLFLCCRLCWFPCAIMFSTSNCYSNESFPLLQSSRMNSTDFSFRSSSWPKLLRFVIITPASTVSSKSSWTIFKKSSFNAELD